ncbi:unnamed protein product [Sordaria macrospora k-hell]|uniref:WGS project CABT00000000 data, contig 2.102 n=1 Tax=Sordaria macrospora (strain ATCC MYA-333 / DSM 997 / K(L3346) / K-hell) TaxID=771870 RepID=F7WC83_SORMK|nr:uncharacterized protein SMAC_09576 [Sordaria macrospora k-hell]CCC05561.1 unnamed protein product [Sordaria macrospora k-hell]
MGLSKLLEEPPFLSFKELKNAGVRRVIYTPAAERLYWEFDGVFPTSTAISVMKNEKGAKDDLEPFFNPDTGTWHEISQLPLTEPKTSSFEVSVLTSKDDDGNAIGTSGINIIKIAKDMSPRRTRARRFSSSAVERIDRFGSHYL